MYSEESALRRKYSSNFHSGKFYSGKLHTENYTSVKVHPGRKYSSKIHSGKLRTSAVEISNAFDVLQSYKKDASESAGQGISLARDREGLAPDLVIPQWSNRRDDEQQLNPSCDHLPHCCRPDLGSAPRGLENKDANFGNAPTSRPDIISEFSSAPIHDEAIVSAPMLQYDPTIVPVLNSGKPPANVESDIANMKGTECADSNSKEATHLPVDDCVQILNDRP
ncbi:hypothetical protein Nepgr_006582 [Nepenthes gracilis]|uniref:Uncharacterized protein n=1 Tax=Nepenthes gracilis TaxID=150966 RepID=A0AAD3S621_NEPGR|nr:hypothetical protein Nepgr_006582 [Nepenthes gracilis]